MRITRGAGRGAGMTGLAGVLAVMAMSIAPPAGATSASTEAGPAGGGDERSTTPTSQAQCTSQLRSARKPYRNGDGNIQVEGTFRNCGNWSEVCAELWGWNPIPAPGSWVPLGHHCSDKVGSYKVWYWLDHQPGFFHGKLVALDKDGKRDKVISSDYYMD